MRDGVTTGLGWQGGFAVVEVCCCCLGVVAQVIEAGRGREKVEEEAKERTDDVGKTWFISVHTAQVKLRVRCTAEYQVRYCDHSASPRPPGPPDLANQSSTRLVLADTSASYWGTRRVHGR
jgi:hypothetical protein